MKSTIRCIQMGFSLVIAQINRILGYPDYLLIILLVFITVDYITGVLYSIVHKKLSSKIGSKGIAKKISIFILVALTNLLDVYIFNSNNFLRSVTITFYISNEGISILENISEMGLPVPESIKRALLQLKNKD